MKNHVRTIRKLSFEMNSQSQIDFVEIRSQFRRRWLWLFTNFYQLKLKSSTDTLHVV